MDRAAHKLLKPTLAKRQVARRYLWESVDGSEDFFVNEAPLDSDDEGPSEPEVIL